MAFSVNRCYVHFWQNIEGAVSSFQQVVSIRTCGPRPTVAFNTDRSISIPGKSTVQSIYSLSELARWFLFSVLPCKTPGFPHILRHGWVFHALIPSILKINFVQFSNFNCRQKFNRLVDCSTRQRQLNYYGSSNKKAYATWYAYDM